MSCGAVAGAGLLRQAERHRLRAWHGSLLVRRAAPTRCRVQRRLRNGDSRTADRDGSADERLVELLPAASAGQRSAFSQSDHFVSATRSTASTRAAVSARARGHRPARAHARARAPSFAGERLAVVHITCHR